MTSQSVKRVRTATIVAHDPSLIRDGSVLFARVEIPDEDLGAGPWGSRLHVIDYDVSTHTLYAPRRGDDHLFDEMPRNRTQARRLLADPTFHASNAYVLAARTLASFERALGRRVSWGFPSHQLKIVPHAFCETNAFYSNEDEALLFGYFRGREGLVFTSLSHDIVVHETTHALLHGLRARFADPSSPDQGAFHEGFSDVIALLSVFALPEVVQALLESAPDSTRAKSTVTRGRIPSGRISAKKVSIESLKSGALLGLAEQFGEELNGLRGHPLRRSLLLPVSPVHYLQDPLFRQVHRRGEILVAAVLNAFVKLWHSRILRLGEANAPHYDIGAVIEEGATAAGNLLTMCIRAVDYSPPCHLTFGDYLSALLTADAEMYPGGGKFGYPGLLKESFAGFGITPASGQPDGAWLQGIAAKQGPLSYSRVHHETLRHDRDEVFRFVWENRAQLCLQEGAYTRVLSVRPCVRIDRDGFALRETVAEVLQQIDLDARELPRWSVTPPRGMPPSTRVTLYGGCTLLFDEFGMLKFNIHNRIDNADLQSQRLEHLWNAGYFKHDRREGALRMRSGGLSLAELHRARSIGTISNTMGGWHYGE